MKSTAVYRQIRDVLGPWFKANGFKRAKGMLSWVRPAGSQFLVVWVQISQHGWDPAQRERVKELQNRVIAKLTRPGPDHFIHQMDQRTRDWYLEEFKPLRAAPSNRDDVWLRYHDADDVEEWARFVLELLPGITANVPPAQS